jgi:RHS repeat-associated protein
MKTRRVCQCPNATVCATVHHLSNRAGTMGTIDKTGFTGVYRDPVTCAYPLGNGYRWHLPGLMRFNAPDSLSPFGAGGINPCVYCANDPINRIDPTGHMFWRSVALEEETRATQAAVQASDSLGATGMAESSGAYRRRASGPPARRPRPVGQIANAKRHMTMAANQVDRSKSYSTAAQVIDDRIRDIRTREELPVPFGLYEDRNSLFKEARASLSRADRHLTYAGVGNLRRNAALNNLENEGFDEIPHAGLGSQVFYRELGRAAVNQMWGLVRWIRDQIGWLLTRHAPLRSGAELPVGFADEYWSHSVPMDEYEFNEEVEFRWGDDE